MKLMTPLFVFLAVVLTAPAVDAAVAPGATAPVLRVIDGDTIEVSINGTPEKVRYIGINAPELHHPTKGAEPFGEQAKVGNSELVEGRTVTLVFDVQHRDRYGRLLAYVYVGDVFVNAELVRRGFAQVATFPPNVRHRENFIRLQREAMANKAGLWGDGEPRQPLGSGVYANKRIRAYYHVDDPNRHLLYTDQWETFESADHAAKVGYHPSLYYADYWREEQHKLGASIPGPSSGGGGYSGGGHSGSGYSGSGYSGSGGSAPGTDVSVRGYTRGDGTYVAPYTRSAPGGGSYGGGSHGSGGRGR